MMSHSKHPLKCAWKSIKNSRINKYKIPLNEYLLRLFACDDKQIKTHGKRLMIDWWWSVAWFVFTFVYFSAFAFVFINMFAVQCECYTVEYIIYTIRIYKDKINNEKRAMKSKSMQKFKENEIYIELISMKSNINCECKIVERQIDNTINKLLLFIYFSTNLNE